MLVTLICEVNMYGELVPEKVRGRYWIEDWEKEITDPERKILGIEAENGEWKIKARRYQKLFEMESGDISLRKPTPRIDVFLRNITFLRMYSSILVRIWTTRL